MTQMRDDAGVGVPTWVALAGHLCLAATERIGMTDKRAALLAELDRLERSAQRMIRGTAPSPPWRVEPVVWATAQGLGIRAGEPGDTTTLALIGEGPLAERVGEYVIEHDPDRTLRRIAGVRAVVELHFDFCPTCHIAEYLRGREGVTPGVGEMPDYCPGFSALYDAYCGGTTP